VLRTNPPADNGLAAAKKAGHRTAASMIEIEKTTGGSELLIKSPILGRSQDEELIEND
jgi:hypothetical protein